MSEKDFPPSTCFDAATLPSTPSTCADSNSGEEEEDTFDDSEHQTSTTVHGSQPLKKRPLFSENLPSMLIDNDEPLFREVSSFFTEDAFGEALQRIRQELTRPPPGPPPGILLPPSSAPPGLEPRKVDISGPPGILPRREGFSYELPKASAMATPPGILMPVDNASVR